MRIIPFETIKANLKTADLFEAVRQAFIDYNSPNLIGIPVNLLHFNNNADVHIKIAAIEGYEYYSIKVASMFPENKKQNLAPYNGAVMLFSAKTGFPEAILQDRGIITDMRTSAAGAIITHHVASANASSVAVLGTGIQAFGQVEALAKLRPLSAVQIYGRTPSNAQALKAKLEKALPQTKISIAKNAEIAVKASEIIITTTPSRIPLVKGAWLQKGQHITAVGADDIYKNEMDAACFDVADQIYIDSLELNRKYGEYSHAICANPKLIDKTTEFGETFKQANAQHTNQITIAKLVGVGVQDLAAATVLMDKLKD